jgi:hypothetical protein
MFAAALLYLKKKYIWTGVFIGLAMASKLTGVFTLLFILAHWMLTNRKSVKEMIKATVTSGFTFLASLTLLDFVIMHRLINPIERIGHMLTYSRELTFALYKSNAPVQLNIVPSRPWQWLYRLDGMAFLTMDMTKIKLLGSQMVISPETTKQVMYCLYEMIINPAIWALIVPCILFVIYLSTKQNKPALFALCWFSATYIIWIPINLITNRLTYDYYFYPAVVAVCIGIALLFSRINEFHVNNHVLRSVQRMITPLYLGISILFFVFLYLGNVWFRAVWAIILFLIILYYLDRFQSPKITRIIVSK